MKIIKSNMMITMRYRKIRRKAKICLCLLLLSTGCTQIPLLSNIIESSSRNISKEEVLQDDFSDKKSGWDQFQIDEGTSGYVGETYQITVHEPNTDIFTTYARTYVNSEIIVMASRKEGMDNNNYGVICRFQDPENFYAGQISSDGYAGIFRIKNGEYELLGHQYMIPVPAIMGGNGENEILFECVDETLALSVNGELADSQEDDTFKAGEFGLIAGTVEGNAGVFQFDDLIVKAK